MQDQRDPTIRDAVDMLSDDETLLPDRAHKALRVGVGIRRPDGRPHDPHARAFDDAAESLRPLGVPIAEQDSVMSQESIDRVGEATSDLRYEGGIGIGGGTRHVHASAPEIDHEQRAERDQPPRGPDLAREEVLHRDRAAVGLQECPPGRRAGPGRAGFRWLSAPWRRLSRLETSAAPVSGWLDAGINRRGPEVAPSLRRCEGPPGEAGEDATVDRHTAGGSPAGPEKRVTGGSRSR